MQDSLYVLLDTGVIIEAHTRGVWAQLINRVTFVVPSTVLEEANCYFDPETDELIPIHLADDVQQGRIIEISADAIQLARFLERFDRVFVERMDPGETEALALLADGTLTEHRFCTGDGPAMRALSLLNMSDCGISFEQLLLQNGLQQRVAHAFTESFFKEQMVRGAQEKIQGIGLRKSPTPPNRQSSNQKQRTPKKLAQNPSKKPWKSKFRR